MEAFAFSASVFSVVSLFIQVAEKIHQLHSFWCSFQKAPAEIRHIALDLEAFCEILDTGARSHVDNDPALAKILISCDSKVDGLKQIVAKLEPGFASKHSIKRKWSSFKATLEKNSLAGFQSSLADTKLDLILINQYVAEKSSRQQLETLTAEFGSQSLSVCSKLHSLNSRTADINKHMNDVHRALRQMVDHVQEQTNIKPSSFYNADLEQIFRKVMQDALQNDDQFGIFQDTALGVSQGKKKIMTATPATWSHNLETNKIYKGYNDEITYVSDKDLKPQFVAKYRNTAVVRKKKTIQCTYTEYKTLFGTLSWRSRTIRFKHEDEILGDTENQEFETCVAIRPAPWLLSRHLDLQMTRSLSGWTWGGRQFCLVERDALIFKYCKDGNLNGVRDLFQHKLASPFDVNIDNYTPLHYAALYGNSTICRLLIKAGAVVDADCKLMGSSLQSALRGPSNAPEDTIIDTFRTLVLYGNADTSYLDSHGSNIWDELGWNDSRTQGLYWLLQQETHFDPDHLNHRMTPLMDLLYVRGDNQDITILMLNLLIDKGVNVDAQTDPPLYKWQAGYTALHYGMFLICAVPYTSDFGPYVPDPYYGPVAHLLRRGANPHLADCSGKSPTAMALASGTFAFGFWQQTVFGYADIRRFVRLELERNCPGSLRDTGWDENALLEIIQCKFEPRSQNFLEDHDDYSELDLWAVFTITHHIEPWWFDLQDLIKAKKNPLPPLPRGWQKVRSSDGSFEYFETSTGTTTSERPKEVFFANLQTNKARRLYKEGLIRIEIEGCESEADGWCSSKDDEDFYESDSHLYGYHEESESASSTESEFDVEERYEHELHFKGKGREDDYTNQAHKVSPLGNTGESDEEEEFYDTHAVPPTVLDK